MEILVEYPNAAKLHEVSNYFCFQNTAATTINTATNSSINSCCSLYSSGSSKSSTNNISNNITNTKFIDCDNLPKIIEESIILDCRLLKEYENKNMGIYRLIHGDPVFTNIIINRYGKIKMIDMRGKLGDNNTIYGDILYDNKKAINDEEIKC